LVGLVVALYLFATIAQLRDFIRTGLPLQGALGFAYLFLAQAQISQFLGPVWTPSWWEYHGLMLISVTLALGALFLELDRRRGLERFLPPVVVERVIQGDPLRLEGERQTVTILFADLRDSTALAEKLSPEQTVATVNAYLRVMARCVLDAGGIVDKFTGDGLMATFGAISDPTDGAHAAARAALTMRTAIAKLNAERAARGELVVAFGIGMHTGDVILGAIGLPERSQYDAIGDAVNTASRMETLTKEFKVDAVLSGDTAARLRDDGVALRPLGEALAARIGVLRPLVERHAVLVDQDLAKRGVDGNLGHDRWTRRRRRGGARRRGARIRGGVAAGRDEQCGSEARDERSHGILRDRSVFSYGRRCRAD